MRFHEAKYATMTGFQRARRSSRESPKLQIMAVASPRKAQQITKPAESDGFPCVHLISLDACGVASDAMHIMTCGGFSHTANYSDRLHFAYCSGCASNLALHPGEQK